MAAVATGGQLDIVSLGVHADRKDVDKVTKGFDALLSLAPGPNIRWY